jgi:hypothetical protein
LAWKPKLNGAAMAKKNRYTQIIESIFAERYREGLREIVFERDDLVTVAKRLNVKLPDNLGDLIYTFRYRSLLPESITSMAPEGEHWIIRAAGKSRYCFALTKFPKVTPNEILVETKIPDATPGIIEMYALSDEQSLLAKVRYNRLIDVFTGVTCYSLQNHLRTSVPEMGQVETDEIYVGIDRKGAHYVFPIQVKGGNDRLSIVQIEQDFAMCAAKFPSLICRPLAGQFMHNNAIALFEFVNSEDKIAVATEKHYRLVPTEELSPEDLQRYAQMTE